MYAAFDKNTQSITLSYPVVLSGTGTNFQGQANDTTSAPSFTWQNDTNTGLYHPSSDVIGMVTNGVERMRWNNDGNVGIGTAVPLNRLHVHGTNSMLTVTQGGNVGIGTTIVPAGISMQSMGYNLMPMPIAILEEKYISSSVVYVGAFGTVPTSTANANTWRVRRLNTFTYPSDTNDLVRSIITLNTTDFTFTIAATGRYHIHAEGSGISVGKHRIALTSGGATADVSAPVIVLNGTSEVTAPVSASSISTFASSGTVPTGLTSSKSTISGIFTVTNTSLKYRIQHITDQPDNIGAFGIPVGAGEYIYLRVIITRYA
jgi:hypothetical protein